MKKELIKIIKKAGKILKKGYYSNKDVTFKAKKDLVTKYDVAVENYLKEKFTKKFKEFNIIAEESDNTNIEFNNSIIIDPIDGTTNFVNGVPHTAISVGVYKDKKPYLAIVYNPILDELYEAKIGKGAYLNGKQLKVSDETELQKALLATGFPYTSGSNEDDLNDVVKKIKDILPLCQDLRRLGSASIDLCLVARGTFEGYYEMNLKPWDVSAGVLILSEAGGKITNINGEEYNLFEDKYIVATNGKIHDELIKNLNLL
ncbi:inositol monophosphatase family protein [Arcobacter defluvii]|uniref:Inositol-1-monophosphatase n=1 Tax=Arcobacter defluvii TaxID=873191 RepID=A0AAE7BFB3_9BACT|nr:inositol monophosphatase family protein [Arcobacter defluvii]QKF76652.1 inositol-phosphate phosphatase [Arcobacter defluvii]RXI34798.1 inositol monophosphatase [Arcobacter defluvii]